MKTNTASNDPGAANARLARQVEEQTTALREYRKAVESSQDLIAVVNRQRCYSLVNEAWLRVHGREREEVIGRPVAEILGEKLFETEVRPRLEEVFKGEHLQFEVAIPHPVLGTLHLHTRYTPIFGEDGDTEAVTIIIRDFTALKQSEEGRRQALAVAEEQGARIAAILASIADGLIVTDLQGEVVLINAVARELLGVSEAEMGNRPAAAALGSPALAAQIERILADPGDGTAADLKVTDPASGAERILQARSTEARNQKGEKTGVTTILQDVTREREADIMKRFFISSAAHELNTPLTAIIGFAELVLETVPPESSQHEYLQIIFDKALYLARIANDLLDLSRMESGHLIAIDKAPCDVDQIIRQAVSDCQMNHGEKHRFEIVLGEPATLLEVDEGRIVQTLENLLGNAVKYSPAGGEIVVSGTLEGDLYRISVSDQGIGMTPEQAAKAFDRYYRGSTSDSAIKGLGIGLALVKTIVELHGGETRIDSTPGVGTRVEFALPLTSPLG